MVPRVVCEDQHVPMITYRRFLGGFFSQENAGLSQDLIFENPNVLFLVAC